MGISSTGILYWGLDFGEYPPWENPEEECGPHDYSAPDDLIWKAFGGKEEDTYKVKNSIAKDAGVEIVLHCSYDYPMWGLAVTESSMRAYRGYPVAIKELVVKPEWEVMLWIAMEKLGFTGEPSWHLTSVYG